MLLGLAVAAGGLPLGLLWWLLAPTVPLRMTDDGAVLIEAQPEQFIAADGWFVLLGLSFGALAAVAAWTFGSRRRGTAQLMAVTVGAFAAGLVAWWLGRQIGLDAYERLLDSAAVGSEFGKPADLRSADARLLWGFLPMVGGDVLAPGLGAAVAYTLLAGWSRHETLRPHEEPEPDPPWPAADPSVASGPHPDQGSGHGAERRAGLRPRLFRRR
ncbi:hypothetical protein GCM10010201_12430 [Pilimelia columellifera subsp. columellifera]|uniref:DUF2567 domain-containing protein n=1 Tax=Pilimelia columellifera subsp. columellifera TaxID=706583 RepID=A0ABN3NAD1_9ACTN